MPNSQPEVRVFQDIHEIDPGLWDSLLSEEDIQMSHDFVSACQDSRVADARFWHLAIYHRG